MGLTTDLPERQLLSGERRIAALHYKRKAQLGRTAVNHPPVARGRAQAVRRCDQLLRCPTLAKRVTL
jgi:hypothetical protein